MNTEVTNDQHKFSSIGARLRNARENMGLSQKTVAERLCLKISIVRDIEEDKIPKGLALTFLRGYIRSYAKLVSISEEELSPIIEKQIPITFSKLNTIRNLSFEGRRKNYDNWLINFTFLMTFVLITLALKWWWQHFKIKQEEINAIMVNNQPSAANVFTNSNNKIQDSPIKDNRANSVRELNSGATNLKASSVSNEKPVQQRNNTTPRISQTLKQHSNVTPIQTNINTSKTKEISTTRITSNGKKPPINSNSSRITNIDNNTLIMKFTADCWLEVTDATNRKLFSGLQHKDNELNIAGRMPYKLIIGAPEAVSIQYLGKFIDLTDFIRTKKVANITITAE